MTATDPKADAQAASYDLLERVVFVLLVILVALRPLISEMFVTGEISILRPIQAAVSGPTPATTAALDAASCALALYVLVRRPRKGIGWRVYYAASVVLAAAVAISTLAADEQRIALNAGVSLVGSVLVIGALTILTNTAGRQRLLLAVVLAGGVATAAQCLLDYTIYNPQTAAQWPQQKQALIEAGYDPNEPMIVNFERRMMANEVSAFQAHPNITASLLTMWVLPLLGLTIAGLIHRGPSLVASIISGLALLGCATSIVLTGSIAGIGAASGGVILLLLIGFAQRWLAKHTAWLAVGLLAGYAALIAGGAGYGFTQGTLPHPSLEVRWFYWTAAADALPDASFTGLGRENFRHAYQQHRPPTSTEEVSNPHNVWVTALVELGPLGLLSSAALFALLLIALSRALKPVEPSSTTPVDTKAAPIETISVVSGLLMFWMLFSDTALQGNHTGERIATLIIWLIENALVWLIGFVAFLVVSRGRQLGLVAPWLTLGILCAVMAAFVHNLVGFSLLMPCGLATLGALAAIGLNLNRRPEAPETSAASQNLAAAVTLVCVGTALVTLVAKPTSDADAGLRSMRGQLAASYSQETAQAAFESGWKAVAADPLDAATPRIIAREILHFVGGNVGQMPGGERWLSNAKAFSEASLTRNPRSVATLKQYAIIHEYLEMAYLLQAKPEEATEALKTSAETWIKAIERHPTDLRGLVDAGVVLTKYWQETEDEAIATQAREYFQRAREIDAGYRDDEPIRLRPHEVERMEKFEAELQERDESAS